MLSQPSLHNVSLETVPGEEALEPLRSNAFSRRALSFVCSFKVLQWIVGSVSAFFQVPAPPETIRPRPPCDRLA